MLSSSWTLHCVLHGPITVMKKKFMDAVEARSFTPFVNSTNGVLAREANSVMK